MEVTHGELVEKELTAFVERRDRQRRLAEGERRMEEAWMESERRYAQRRREANRLAWACFHEEQAERHRRTLAGLIAHHETEAERLAP